MHLESRNPISSGKRCICLAHAHFYSFTCTRTSIFHYTSVLAPLHTYIVLAPHHTSLKKHTHARCHGFTTCIMRSQLCSMICANQVSESIFVDKNGFRAHFIVFKLQIYKKYDKINKKTLFFTDKCHFYWTIAKKYGKIPYFFLFFKKFL